jgi:hypothetical protein
LVAESPEGGLGRGRMAVRVTTIAALLAAVVVVAIVLFGEGTGRYSVKARFINASQLVKGNPVQIGGVSIGSVERILRGAGPLLGSLRPFFSELNPILSYLSFSEQTIGAFLSNGLTTPGAWDHPEQPPIRRRTA